MTEFGFFVLMPLTRTSSSHQKKKDKLSQILFLFAWPPKQSKNLTVSPASLQKPHSVFPLLDVKTEEKNTSQWASTCCFPLTAAQFMILLDKQTTEWGRPSFLRFFTRLSAPIISMKTSRVKRSHEGRVPGFNFLKSAPTLCKNASAWRCIGFHVSV